MKLRDDRGKLDLTRVIDDNVSLVKELREKLKAKCNEVLDLRKEIDRLQEIIKDNPNDWTQVWFIGGIVAGCLLSLGVYYAAVEISK